MNGSRFATLGGAPVAVIGVAAYLLIVAALAVRRWGPPASRPAGYASYGLAAAGTAFSLYLTALEAFIVHAYCTWWCLVSAVPVTAGYFVASVDLAAEPRV